MADFITIDSSRLAEIVDGAQRLDDGQAYEYDIKILLENFNLLSKAVEAVKNGYKTKFGDSPSRSVEGDYVRVMTYQSGAKYQAKDIESVEPQFLKVQLDPAPVDAYVKANNKLPEGIEYKKRSIAVRLTLKEVDHE